jgi:maltokinase
VSPERALARLVPEQRWFGAKARALARGGVVDWSPLSPPDCVLALWAAEFADGGRELFQLPYRGHGDGLTISLAEPVLAHALLQRFGEPEPLATRQGRVEFALLAALPADSASLAVRPVGGEQSNSSIVFGERLILKAYRRLEPGESPELEVLRFLSAHGFEHLPRLLGWYSYSGETLNATLGILQSYEPDARDGWVLALESLADPGPFLTRLHSLGEVTARMHDALASDRDDPAFRPEAPAGDGGEEEARSLLAGLPVDGPAGPVHARRAELVEHLCSLRDSGAGGLAIRQHGDYHLGQVLWGRDGWLVLDFEGEPARPLAERRHKSSPLRDVAGALRSFAYVAETARSSGTPAPAGWEDEARASFLDGYYGAVDDALLPPVGAPRDDLLAACELQKALYELRYELDHRPAWVRVPAAGLLRLLGER